MPANVDFSTNYTFAQANDYCRQLGSGMASLFDPSVCGSNLQAFLKDELDVVAHSTSMKGTNKTATGVLCHILLGECFTMPQHTFCSLV